MKKRWLMSGCFILLLVFITVIVDAKPNKAQQEQMDKAFAEANKVQQKGPAEIPLIDQGKIKISEKYTFVPQPQAGTLMKSMGNTDNQRLIGLIFPLNEKEEWLVAIEYEKSGYIKDDDAKDWDADELLQSIKKGTEEANKERKKKGFRELEVMNWVESPKYDSAKHQLVWSLSSREKGGNPAEVGINYNTYVLGREGYIILTFVTDLKKIEREKPIAAELLNATKFVDGKRYEDFNSSTDKIAEYGLAALVAGAAAKKLGFFAAIAAFLLKFSKVIVAVVAAVGALLYKLTGRKKKGDDHDNSSTQPPPQS